MKLISPVIAEHGVQYVSNKFEERLSDGTLTLSNTCTWLRSTIISAVDSDVVNLYDLTHRDSAKNAAYLTILDIGILDMIKSEKKLLADECPEILRLDIKRISSAQHRFQVAVVASCVLIIVSKKLMDIGVRDPGKILNSLSVKFFDACDISNMKVFVTSICEDIGILPQMSEADLISLKTALLEGVESGSPVSVLMTTRIYDMMFYALRVGAMECFVGDGKVDTVFTKFKIPRSTFSLAPHFQKSVSELCKMINLLRRVHAQRLNSIVSTEAIGLTTS